MEKKKKKVEEKGGHYGVGYLCYLIVVSRRNTLQSEDICDRILEDDVRPLNVMPTFHTRTGELGG